MAASSTNVQYLIGELYDAMGSDKDSIITAMITRAGKYVTAFTGATSGDLYDTSVESWAAIYILQRMTSGSNSTNSINLGAITIGKKDISDQIKSLKEDAMSQLKILAGKQNLFRLTQQLNL